MIPYLTVHLDVAGRCVELRSHRRRPPARAATSAPPPPRSRTSGSLIPATSGDCAEVPAVTEGGEVVPGVTVTVRPPSFTVVTEEVAD